MAILKHVFPWMKGGALRNPKDNPWTGSKSKLEKLPVLTRDQRKVQEFLLKNKLPGLPSAQNNPNFQAGSNYLQNLLGQQPQERYSQLEAPYMRQFQQETMPGIAEQYAGAGALNSSGFQNAAANAGQSLMERLASLNLGQQNLFRNQQLSALPMAQSYSQQPYNEQLGARLLQLQRMGQGLDTQAFRYNMTPGQPGFLQNLSSGLGTQMGMGLGMGGEGGGIGGMMSNMFGGGNAGGGENGGMFGMTPGGTAGSIGGGLLGAPFGPLGMMAGSKIGGWLGGLI